ncbi:hypothetical protein CRYUN_Cryun19dG0008000 [Craigia yunnanensis]
MNQAIGYVRDWTLKSPINIGVKRRRPKGSTASNGDNVDGSNFQSVTLATKRAGIGIGAFGLWLPRIHRWSNIDMPLYIASEGVNDLERSRRVAHTPVVKGREEVISKRLGTLLLSLSVIDEEGNPVPLHETYLHHWVVGRYYLRKGMKILGFNDTKKLNSSDYISGRNIGICQNRLGQFFGLGSETRKTTTDVPDPYGIEVGNPAEIPSGFEERWMLNIHAIDTRGVEDKWGCIECSCDLYNVTEDEYGRSLRPDYKGGLLCCYNHTQCRVKQGFEGIKRNLYLRYTVKWVDMDSSVVPVKIYIFDITDSWKRSSSSTGINSEHYCKVEYEVESCRATGLADDGCIDNKRISLDLPFGGYVIYGVAHQHAGGSGSAL